MKEFIRTAALDLTLSDSMIRTAGIAQRIKNWIKYRTNQEFRQVVDTLKADSAVLRAQLELISDQIDNLEESIKNGDAEKYHALVPELKKSMLKLWEGVKQTSDDGKNFYTAQDMDSPGFADWFAKNLPEGYDLEIGKKYDIPLKSTRRYAQLQPTQISISTTPLNIIKGAIQKQLPKPTILQESDQDLVQALLAEVPNGILKSLEAKKPHKKNPTLKGGTTELEVIVKILLPITNAIFSGTIFLVDYQDRMVISGSKDWKYEGFITQPTTAGLNPTQLLKIAIEYRPQALKYYPATEQDLAQALRSAYVHVYGEDPTAETLAGGWAQATLEAGRPLKFPNYNIGNIKATPGGIKSGQPYFIKGAIEFTPDGKKTIIPHDTWASFSSLEEGAAAYWKLIKNKYSSAQEWMAAGDPISASVALGKGGYFTANIAKYSQAMQNLYKEFFDKVAISLPGLRSAPIPASQSKPEVKNWKSDYQSVSTKDNEVESLIKNLTADGPLTTFVKKAILRQVLPQTLSVIWIRGTRAEQLDFAKKASFILHSILGSTVEICAQDEALELETKTYGHPLTVLQAQTALCDLLSQKFAHVQAQPIVGFTSSLPKLSASKLDKLYRQSFFQGQL